MQILSIVSLQAFTSEYMFHSVQITFAGSVAMSLLYYLCYSGSKIVTRFEDVSHEIYKISWYLLPLDMQKPLPTMIAFAQNPVYLQGYGICCTLGTFKEVRHEIQFNSWKFKSWPSNFDLNIIFAPRSCLLHSISSWCSDISNRNFTLKLLRHGKSSWQWSSFSLID